MKPGIFLHWTDWLRLFGLTVCIYVVAGVWAVWMFHLVMSIGK